MVSDGGPTDSEGWVSFFYMQQYLQQDQGQQWGTGQSQGVHQGMPASIFASRLGVRTGQRLQKNIRDCLCSASFSVCFPQIFKQTRFLAEMYVEMANVAEFSRRQISRYWLYGEPGAEGSALLSWAEAPGPLSKAGSQKQLCPGTAPVQASA